MHRSVIVLFLTLSLIFGCHHQTDELVQLRKMNQELMISLNECQERTPSQQAVSLAGTEVQRLQSQVNGQTYQLYIKYPKGYHESKASYPVLYVIDAETNFGGVSYIVQRLIKDRLIPKVLVVGIAYGTTYKQFYKLRSRDLTPVEDKDLKMGGAKVADPTGGAPQFSRFMEEELFPFVQANYRVKENDRAIYGHSYGGLFGAYALLHQPQLFNRYLILSPSLWFKETILIDDLRKMEVDEGEAKVYMASGELERRIDVMQTEFAKILADKKSPALALKAELMPNETHRTIFGPGFTNGMRYLYGE
ncbi:MAG: alpha/beta hydrolase-fold protein [Bacteroidota bacterium]